MKSKLSERVEQFREHLDALDDAFSQMSAIDRHRTMESVIREAFKREQGVGVMRERRSVANHVAKRLDEVTGALPGGAMVLVPLSFMRSDATDEWRGKPCGCVPPIPSDVALNGERYSIVEAKCPIAKLYLADLRKRGAT